jgi:hypothetical protein
MSESITFPNEEIYVIRGSHVVENKWAIRFFGLKEPHASPDDP